jgi:hypothetical protein
MRNLERLARADPPLMFGMIVNFELGHVSEIYGIVLAFDSRSGWTEIVLLADNFTIGFPAI